MRQALLSIICAVVLVAPAGCGWPAKEPAISEAIPAGAWPALTPNIAGTSVQGRPIEYFVLGDGHDTTLLIAAIHGNEPAGTALLRWLADYLRQNPPMLAGKTVVIMPVANPDGLAADTRENANSVDLNRNFATANRINNVEYGSSPLSEPEAVAVKRIINTYKPCRIVSIHQPLECIDYDGPGRNLAEQMSRYCELPVRKLGAQPGSLGSYAGITLGVPIITLELRQADRNLTPQRLWDRYGRALLAAITYRPVAE